MKKFILSLTLIFLNLVNLIGQETFPVNGINDKRITMYAFINGTIYINAETVIPSGTLLIKDGYILDVGEKVVIPNEAIVIDCKGKYIYPSFIDPYTDFGQDEPPKANNEGNFFRFQQKFESSKNGPLSWNEAIHPEINAITSFKSNNKRAETFRKLGFGAVLSHKNDGIARGTGIAVNLSDEKENLALINPTIAQYFSFKKGSSTQTYPSSMMGAVALLRQSFYDAIWYAQSKTKKEINLSLEALNTNKKLVQVFEAEDKWDVLRADRIGDEFNIQFVFKTGTNGYQRIQEIKNTNGSFILDLNFPAAMDLSNSIDAHYVSLDKLMDWELAPSNPTYFAQNQIPFCFTTDNLAPITDFTKHIQLAIKRGLPENLALNALTIMPAKMFNLDDKLGSLAKGKLANFLITTQHIFDEKNKIIENWVQGQKYEINPEEWLDISGYYETSIKYPNGENQWFTLILKKDNKALIYTTKDSFEAKYTLAGQSLNFYFENKKNKNHFKLNGYLLGTTIQGYGTNENGQNFNFTSQFTAKNLDSSTLSQTKNKSKDTSLLSSVVYPFNAYGNKSLPETKTTLFKNATVWTNEKDGILLETDVLVDRGKIVAIGKNLNAPPKALIIDATGKHLTPGIIDEHSHIAAFSINEGGESVTSEVRIKDNLNPDDVNIYRQLSGGVTSSHILHGSANTIGGQTQLIKLKWGGNENEIMFQHWDPFIKFALGENVKRTSLTTGNSRYPDTRSGVQEVLDDAFNRAVEYKKELQTNPIDTRKNLELEALVEILDRKRFITCHSYVASEILGAIKIGEKYGFVFNTFTHILEGYKVADELKQHGSNVSTFADWWGYKNEVKDAIAYNASLMHQVGLNVCINSDDAEMARRLNQEAAKVIKYGGCSEEDALKMVTLNPAKALHIDNMVGSIKVQKDGDLVLWSDNPLSIYAQALITMVDGTIYFDRVKDLEKRAEISKTKEALVEKMIAAQKQGSPTKPVNYSYQFIHTCDDNEIEQKGTTIYTNNIYQ